MKKLYKFSIISALLLISSASLSGQEVDEIIAKHIKAHGGIKKYEAIESMKITGQFTGFSVVNEFTTIKTKSGLYHSEYHLGKHKIIEAYNGEYGWTIDPWQEIDYARNINEAEMNVFEQKAVICTPFFNYKEKGGKLEYIGKENLEGTEVFVIKLIKANQNEETWYLDVNTFLEYKTTSQWIDFAWPNQSEVYYDDFRAVNGLIIPFLTERTFGTRHQVTEIESIEVNVETDYSIFEFPLIIEMKKLAFLKGKWNVTVDVRTRRGTWYRVDSVESQINFAANNLLQENISYSRILPITKIINYSYNASTEKYRLSVFNDLAASFSVYEGIFNDTAFIVDNLNISYSDTTSQDNNSFQYIWYNMDQDGFTLEMKMSTDKGATWNHRDKFTYTRKKE